MSEGRKRQNWTPSPRQVEIAQLLLNPEDRRTKKAKIESVGLPERTFYRWLADERFTNYLNSQLEIFTNSELVEVWHALTAQAKRGNVQAIKLFFEMKNLYRLW